MSKKGCFSVTVIIVLMFGIIMTGCSVIKNIPLDLIEKVVFIALGLYELISRAFPTVKDISIIGNIIKVLKWISDALNNVKK